MIIEQRLMRNLMRACGASRRLKGKSEDSAMPKGRGFGHILDLLSEEGMSQQQIAAALDIRAQSVSEAIAVLESRGFIRKEASRTDKRMTLIFITPEGENRRREIFEERKAHAIEFFSVLNEEEKEQLLHLLEKMNSAHADKKEEL